MDWLNVDLSSPYEREQDFLSGYDFETLLLEVQCNLRELIEEAILKHAYTEIDAKAREAKAIVKANIKAILKEAVDYRNID